MCSRESAYDLLQDQLYYRICQNKQLKVNLQKKFNGSYIK